ncbi:hypothetical protein KSP39_PZI009681 [Platanthera zijinensis]|uniref:Retrovirus-related Pol polyprotein from transposon TNT 1-94 n=1 Tax=Platanthera zijinensis TaxID=2320716 RepID=A0AAP0BL07_9ASPA
MSTTKSVGTPLGGHFKLGSKQCPSSKKKKDEMQNVLYASAVGSLMYAMVCTRLDLSYVVGVVSRFLSNPDKEHWAAVKWILIYLRGLSKMCLRFGCDQPVLETFTNADMAGDVDSRKFTLGYLITYAGGAVSWKSRLHKCVVLSTTEVEYITTTKACKETLWMKKFLQELGQVQDKYVLHCDSQSVIHLSKNSSFHARSKHIDVRYHWICDVLETKAVQIEKVHTVDNGSNMMTMTIPKDKLEACLSRTGMVDPSTKLGGGVCLVSPSYVEVDLTWSSFK